MKTFIFKIILIISTFISCNQASKETTKIVIDKLNLPTNPSPNPTWVDSGKVKMNINTDIKYEKLLIDSAIIISYKGKSGEIIYEPLNSEGKWLDSIYNVKKLTYDKIKLFDNIVQNHVLSNYDNQLCCFDPQFGVILFKNGAVIGHFSFSKKDSKIQSTFILNNGQHHAKLNDKQAIQLNKLVEFIEPK